MNNNLGIEQVELKPPASALIQSLRSIGYPFNSAIADIVDNSISAESGTTYGEMPLL